jgi:atypical dual specificity phosphatase
MSLTKNEWLELGIAHMHIPIQDFVGLPSIDQVQQAVGFINLHSSNSDRVYVHCKAGRYRSALMVACYLIHKNRDWTCEQVIDHLKTLRSSVLLERADQIDLMNKYRELINS